MPKRTDINTILLIGAGPIVIGQGCEFDYSGTQACKALKAEGYRVVLVNSNPATIMTDPGLSDRTYIEPVTPDAVRKILAKQKAMGDPVDAVLPTLGGQTALNCACKLWDTGVFQEFGVEMIGASREVIHRAEDRQLFKDICEKLGLRLPKAKTVTTMDAALEFLAEIGLPAIIRPAFTLGGSGGGIAYNRDEFIDIITRGLRASMIGQVQIDQSVIGWKEFELEVVRDKKDNCVIVCGIENIDPMGVHTGDSITVAPIQTLSDKEYQAMRDASIAIMRAVGVETGGSNVQFAVNPNPKPNPDGSLPFEMVVVEMNPRVSRSSALASKATGFPIAKIAAKLAVGYTLDELRNDITGTTSACFEPSIDYVVTKIPRWTFEKFPEADETLTTQMKSVGEAMSIGRTFAESLQKAIRSMEVKRYGLGLDRNDKWLAALRAFGAGVGLQGPYDTEATVLSPADEAALSTDATRGEIAADPTAGPQIRTADGEILEWPIPDEKLRRKLAVPSQGRLFFIRYAMKMGWTDGEVHDLTNIDPWFLAQIREIVEFEDELMAHDALEELPRPVLFKAKQLGYSDAQLANLYLGAISPDTILQVRAFREGLGIKPVFKLVDTCAAEFAATTPYYYSTYETPVRVNGEWVTDDEIRVTDKKKVIIIGGGPNRIGQGIEFDYCCCHAAFAAKELGFEAVMINSNPETVSTDYDTSDLLFFEPLTLEDVLNVVERLNGRSLMAPNRVTSRVPLDEKLHSQMMSALQNKGYDRCLVVGAPELFNPHGWGLTFLTPDDQCWTFVWDTPGEAKDLFHWQDEKSIAQRLYGTGRTGLVHGLIVQFGGQTPLNLAKGLAKAGAPIIGTSVDSIDLAEDRDRFDALLSQLGLQKPASGIARTLEQAVKIANRIGYPVLVRPSYVLGGRGMEICSDEKTLTNFMSSAAIISDLEDAPVLIDRFLSDATEIDVDVVADFAATVPGGADTRPVSSNGQDTGSGQALVCSVMEHIEQAGIHSGDSSCSIPPWSLDVTTTRRIQQIARTLAQALHVRGLMNVQMALKDGQVYILEVNPRASRTVPFVGKATHTPWPRIAAKVMMGKSLAEMGVREVETVGSYAFKVSVFPFNKFPGVDVVLGPEMRSTGEVMGIDSQWPVAFAKGLLASGITLPTAGSVFLSVRSNDKPAAATMARDLVEMGFTVHTTAGTAEMLRLQGTPASIVQKIESGVRPNVLDLMADGKIQLVINTPTRTGWKTDEGKIRAAAVRLGIPMITTATGGLCAVKAIRALREGDWGVAALQDYAKIASGYAAARH